MKHIIIGDLHGKDVWKEIEVDKFDRVVFLGDYVDSFTLPDLIIDQNLQDIIALKKSLPDKIILLLGNHDIQYLYYPHFRCSGYRESMKRPLRALFTYNRNLFQVAYQCKNHLFTHAGVTNAWYLEFINIPMWREQQKQKTLADILNAASESGTYQLLFNTGSSRGGHGNGGITWADQSETRVDMLIGYHQYVGHTPVDDVESLSYGDTSITYLDVLDTKNYFYEINC